MTDIELVIKIPEGLKNDFVFEHWTALSCMAMKNALEKAIPLPKGHGRLIDADELKLEITDLCGDIYNPCYGVTYSDINSAPTIIEADNEE